MITYGRTMKIMALLISMNILTTGIVFAGGRQDSTAEPKLDTSAEYRKITAAQAHKMMSELNEYVLLDVRTIDTEDFPTIAARLSEVPS